MGRSPLSKRARSRLAVGAVVLGIIGASCAAVACVLADPPPDIPSPPEYHPVIISGSVVPPNTTVLAELPSQFLVPLEVFDSTTFYYEAFVDFDPLDQNAGLVLTPQSVDPSQVGGDGGVYIADFSVTTTLDPSVCHVIEFIVAFGFNKLSLHTPDARGGDSISWFYNPTGEPGGCPGYDAGALDGAFLDGNDGGIVVQTGGD